MQTSFREAMIAAMKDKGIGATELSKLSGVSKGQIDKLCQRRAATTNVDDGIKIAQALGNTIEGLCRTSDVIRSATDRLMQESNKCISVKDENTALRKTLLKCIIAAEIGGKVTIS